MTSSTEKRRHHYVFRFHLKAWANNKDIIWCCQNGKVFNPSLMNIAQKRDFYKLNRLTKKDIEFIYWLINWQEPSLKQLNSDWVSLFTYIFKIKDRIGNKAVDKEIDRAIHNMMEDKHSLVESNSIPHLKALRKQDISFLKDPGEFNKFAFFLALQYFRTNRLKTKVSLRFLKEYGEDEKNKIESTWNILAFVFATNLGADFVASKGKQRFVLLINNTDLEFITGDQPIINTKSNSDDKEVDELELYYPISPGIALLMSEDEAYEKTQTKELSREEVNGYNTKMVKMSLAQIYASKKTTFEYYI